MNTDKNIEGGQEKIREFVRGLIEKKGLKEEEKEAEQKRLEDLTIRKIFDEILASLPEEDLEEIEKAVDDETLTEEKIYSMMFLARVKPESIVTKVFHDIEAGYLGVDDEDDDDVLIETIEEEGKEEQADGERQDER